MAFILLSSLACQVGVSNDAAPPVLVKDIWPGGTYNLRELTDVNGTLFFAANDGANGRELWKSDGTEVGTVMVKNIDPRPWVQNAKNPGYMEVGSSRPDKLTNVNGTLFFLAENGVNERSLWKSDGTEDGTALIKDIRLWKTAAFGEQLIALNSSLLFVAYDQAHGVELWRSDGTEESTVMVKDILPGEEGSGPTALTIVDGTLFFRANSNNTWPNLWKSDGTKEGTERVKMIGAHQLTNVNGTLFFTAGQHGEGLWKSDGTEAGTLLVKDINARGLTNKNGVVYFRGDDGTNEGPWQSDGTEEGTVPVESGPVLDSSPGNGGEDNGPHYFAKKTELWKTER